MASVLLYFLATRRCILVYCKNGGALIFKYICFSGGISRLPDAALKFSIKGTINPVWGLTTITPPITGENIGTTAGSVAGSAQ